jgi:hypothetical protein
VRNKAQLTVPHIRRNSRYSKADCQFGSRRKELETRIDKGDRASLSGPICFEYLQNCGNNRGFGENAARFLWISDLLAVLLDHVAFG